jgi:hypothetical protein
MELFTYRGKYKSNKIIGYLGMFICFAWLFFIAYSYHFQMDFFQCQADWGQVCKNPFYTPQSWKNSEFLPSGSYGTPLGPLFYSAFWVPLFVIAFTLFVNHRIYNYDFKFNFSEILKQTPIYKNNQPKLDGEANDKTETGKQN